MNKAEALRKFYYGEREYIKYLRFEQHVKCYDDADEYCIVNDGDRSLLPIWIPLPRPPDWHLIDGWGLERRDQVFKYVEYPARLRELEREYDTINGLWEELELNPLYYKEEIAWIRRQIWHELNGYWFFCNGKPTYLPGDYYVYLNFWTLDVGRPEYRDRDRKIFLFDEFIERDNRFRGFNYPKHRREGATSKAGFKNYITISRKINGFGGMQSKTEEHAKKVFSENIIKPWRRLPFFLKPEYDGTDNPKEILNFIPPANTATKDKRGRKSGLIAKGFGLGGNITFKSSDVFSYDGSKLHFYHGDEVGKTKDVDTHERYMVVKQCLGVGAQGHCWNTSTVEEMEAQGGKAFKKTCQQSQYHDIFENDNEQTITGLATLFIPATEGLEIDNLTFIGKYGESIIETPTEAQIEFLKQKNPSRYKFIGSKEYLMNERRKYEEQMDTHGLLAFKRKFPMEYSDCWISSNFDTGMPHDVIQARMDQLSYVLAKNEQDVVRRGDFKRLGRERYSSVIFVDNPDGRFELSWWFKHNGESNKMVFVNGEALPQNTHFGIAGADPFKFTKNKNRRFSDGGGGVFMYRGMNDTDENLELWEGHRFICAYRHKPPTKQEYFEDMAMMCQYFGVLMFSENNVPDLNDWFEENGYRHYLKYLLNKKTGKFEVNPGIWTTEAVKQKIWSMHRDYLRIHGMRECHMEYLQECLDIDGIEKMGDYDLFAAFGMALIGSDEQVYESAMDEVNHEYDLADWY